MWALLQWIGDYWFVILWLTAIIVAYLIGGQRIALAVATFGAVLVSFKVGQTTEKKTYNEKAETINREREAAYEEIDNRDTSRDDVIKRLQKRDY